MVRIPGFHPGDPGSSPGYGMPFTKNNNQLYPQEVTLQMPWSPRERVGD